MTLAISASVISCNDLRVLSQGCASLLGPDLYLRARAPVTLGRSGRSRLLAQSFASRIPGKELAAGSILFKTRDRSRRPDGDDADF